MKLNIAFDELGLPVDTTGNNTQSCADVGKYFTLLNINKKILDQQVAKTNPPRPKGEVESFEEYDDYINTRNSSYNEMLTNRGLGAVVDSDLSFIDKLSTLKTVKGKLLSHPSIGAEASEEQVRSVLTGIVLYDFTEELANQKTHLLNKYKFSIPTRNLLEGRKNKIYRLLDDAMTLVQTVKFTITSYIYGTVTDDTTLLMKLVAAKVVHPTALSRAATKFMFKFRSRSTGDTYRVGMDRGVAFAWYKARNRCNVTSAVSWEYRPSWLGGTKGEGWMGLWEPVINWLKE
jgi:hypothetical protein